jgi:GT2 family glycosyltransferase
MTALPTEIIVADSDSTDRTIELLKNFFVDKPCKLTILSGKCSISAGRNKAVRYASFSKVAVSDFGICFDQNWLEEIYRSLEDFDWVGGCYKLAWGNSIQHAYCKLFNKRMSDLNESKFLPSSRSFGIRKEVFLEMQGYNENFAVGEDTDLVLRLKNSGKSYSLNRNALVYWYPRETFFQIYIQQFRYSWWDGRIGQNYFRLIYTFFVFSFLGSMILFLVERNLPCLLFFVVCLCAFFAKVYFNIKRNGEKIDLISVLLYFAFLLGGAFGFLGGIFNRLFVRGYEVK